MKRAGIITGAATAIALIVWVCIGAFAPAGVSQEDRAVVTCAEAMLWDYSYTYAPEWGYISPQDSHRAFLISLALDDIFLYEEHHPFIEKERDWLALQGYSSYTAFKADYYRDMFDWGHLPPAEIIEASDSSG